MIKHLPFCLTVIIIFLVFSPVLTSAQGVNEQDSLALVALYNSTDGDNWDDNTNWLSTKVADWYGVTVREGYVSKINLRDHLTEAIL